MYLRIQLVSNKKRHPTKTTSVGRCNHCGQKQFQPPVCWPICLNTVKPRCRYRYHPGTNTFEAIDYLQSYGSTDNERGAIRNMFRRSVCRLTGSFDCVMPLFSRTPLQSTESSKRPPYIILLVTEFYYGTGWNNRLHEKMHLSWFIY